MGQQEPVSVLIPAHNEAGVIAGCLDSVLTQTTRRALRVVVVANGCTDPTAELARSYVGRARRRGFELLVEELVLASKPNALNHADTLAAAGHRIYLDADIRLSPDALEEVIAELDSGDVDLCAPAVRVAPARSFLTRCYAAVWVHLPVVRGGVVGCGFYGVTTAGRARWGRFPTIISDDKFVRLHFEPSERRVTERGSFLVHMPEGPRELISVRGRWCRGNRDLVRLFPEISRREPGRYLPTLRFLLSRPDLWARTPVFGLVFLGGEVIALLRRRVGISVWERARAARTFATPRSQT